MVLPTSERWMQGHTPKRHDTMDTHCTLVSAHPWLRSVSACPECTMSPMLMRCISIQPPGIRYAVYTPVTSMTIGGRFLCLDSLSATLTTRLNTATNIPCAVSGYGHSVEKVMRRMLLWAVYQGDTNLRECFVLSFNLNDDSVRGRVEINGFTSHDNIGA